MTKPVKFLLIGFFCLLVLILAAGTGSVFIAPADCLKILLNKLFAMDFSEFPGDIAVSILWKIRLPRVALAFFTGAALSVSGVIMQSVLRNPLASSYTLGVSSGAAMGASFAILLGISTFGMATLPIFGLGFGLLTVFLAITAAARINKSMDNATIILTGMAFSLFANAIITLLMSLARSELQTLIFWQMGSFALKDWYAPGVLLPVLIITLLVAVYYSQDMDIMTFGEEYAKLSGVRIERTKVILLATGAIATGCCVAFTGIIGFVDLFTPHVARKIIGSAHVLCVPASALLGGCFMVLCDLTARTIASPLELPVGAVTALAGAPFFIYIFMRKARYDGAEGKNASG